MAARACVLHCQLRGLPDIDGLVASLVILSAFLHPCRDLLLKGIEDRLAAYLGVCVGWCVLALVQALIFEGGVWLETSAWWLVGVSATGLTVYYFGTLEALRTGHLSVYYPIIRSSPLAIVAFNWVLFGQSYSATVLAGISLIVVSGVFLQGSTGSLFDDRRSLMLAMAAMVASAVYALADAAAMQIAEPARFVFWVYLLVSLILAGLAIREGGSIEMRALQIARTWQRSSSRIIAASVSSFVSYYFILLAFQMQGDPAQVVAVRQISIPISVVLAALFLAEPRFLHRFGWAAALAAGVVIVMLG